MEKREQKKNEEKNLMGIFQHPLIPKDLDEVLTKKVKRFGNNSAHITGIDKRHVGKLVRVIIKKEEEVKE